MQDEQGEIRIPTAAEHRRTVKRIWIICLLAASFVVCSMGGIIGSLYIRNVEVARIVSASTIFFQLLIAMAFLGFTVPLFLEQRANLSLSILMGRKSLDLGVKSVDTLGEMQSELKPVVADLKYIAEKSRPVADALHKAVVEEQILETIRDDMAAIRRRIERDTEPLPVKRRPPEQEEAAERLDSSAAESFAATISAGDGGYARLEEGDGT